MSDTLDNDIAFTDHVEDTFNTMLHNLNILGENAQERLNILKELGHGESNAAFCTMTALDQIQTLISSLTFSKTRMHELGQTLRSTKG